MDNDKYVQQLPIKRDKIVLNRAEKLENIDTIIKIKPGTKNAKPNNRFGKQNQKKQAKRIPFSNQRKNGGDTRAE